MMTRKNRKLHTAGVRNGGFSLLELVVSVTILAVILVPLLSAFFVSARSVSKSKQTADQNAVAQSLYEKIQAKDADYFFYPLRGKMKTSVPAGGSTSDIKDPGAYKDMMEYLGGKGYTGTNDITWTSSDDDTSHHGDKISIGLPNLFSNAQGTEYGAKIDIQSGALDTAGAVADKEQSGDVEDLVSGSTISGINEKKLTEVMNFTHFWAQSDDPASDPDQRVLDQIGLTKEDAAQGAVTDPNKARIIRMKRTILVELNTDKTAGTTYVIPTIYYAYNIEYTMPDPSGTGGRKRYVIRPDATLKQTATDSAGEAVFSEKAEKFAYSTEDADGNITEQKDFDFFLAFQPFYNGRGYGASIENIMIDNRNNLRGNVYLLKQSSQEDDSRLYSGTVKLYENHPGNKTNFNITVHTNMGLAKDSTPDNEKRIAGNYALRKFYRSGDGSLAATTDKWFVDGSHDQTFMRLINQQANERAYRVTIRIYRQRDYGTGDPEYTLQGFKLD